MMIKLNPTCRASNILVIAIIVLSTTACSATSRMPQAQISEVNGLPCFAVADEAETKGGVRLYSLLVSEQKSADWKTLPNELWRFNVIPAGAWIDTNASTCIRYGETPKTAIGTQAKTLESFQIYVAAINAKPKNSDVSVITYRTEFCVKPNSIGKIALQIIPWDENLKQWRYAVCTKP